MHKSVAKYRQDHLKKYNSVNCAQLRAHYMTSIGTYKQINRVNSCALSHVFVVRKENILLPSNSRLKLFRNQTAHRIFWPRNSFQLQKNGGHIARYSFYYISLEFSSLAPQQFRRSTAKFLDN